MTNPIGFNPAQTNATADDYIATITTLPDASWVLVPKVDPNNAGETIYEKITVANLKAALGPTTLKSVTSLAATFQTYTDVVIADTDVLAFAIKLTLSSNTQFDGDILLGSMITTTASWLSIKGGESGSRLEIKKNASNQLQMRRQGPISNVNVVVLKLN